MPYKDPEYLKEYLKKWNAKNPEYLKEYLKKWRAENKEYHKKWRAENKEYHKKWRAENKGYHKKWFLENKEHKIKYNKKWYLENKEKIIENNKKWQKNKRYNDPNFRLRCNLGTRIWNVLKGLSKSANTMKLIGCTIDELWQHLESKFQNGMTRENYGRGGWDVDHIKPCAHFDLTNPEQQRICFHWTNLQPMWHIENIKKGARII